MQSRAEHRPASRRSPGMGEYGNGVTDFRGPVIRCGLLCRISVDCTQQICYNVHTLEDRSKVSQVAPMQNSGMSSPAPTVLPSLPTSKAIQNSCHRGESGHSYPRSCSDLRSRIPDAWRRIEKEVMPVRARSDKLYALEFLCRSDYIEGRVVEKERA